MQHCPSDAPTRPALEAVIGDDAAGPVAHPDERGALGVDAEPIEQRQGTGHESLATGLIDRTLAGLEHHDREPGEPRLDRGSEAHRPAAHYEHIGVATHSSRSARFSVGMRNPSSSTALSTVNTIAVIHAVWTSGSAMPSTATTT